VISAEPDEFAPALPASITIQRRLEWIDTDASGAHHNTAAIRLMEAAELALIDRLGFLDDVYGLHPRTRIEAEFLRPLFFRDLVEVALRQALGEPVPDELALPLFSQPLAIRFFTAEPGPLPTGRVVAIGSLDTVLESPGVVQADTYLQIGEIIRPVRRDGDRRGYVIAVADTWEEALGRAEDAALLFSVEVAA